ncbi:LysR substrate-binding domain-containing protein [Mesorhizobium caraganae]|uniref:LysR substrate-binding domain-containing protein n=1 Tax=Mesorhizobium caraganae TaxID=483206 RepID=UPI00177E4A68|nr:LysR substrate-binding domain-containing protein [Mesorhizobium caraganae]
MEKLDRHIASSMTALLVLEAAVKHRNFSLAGRKFNLSQPAVSRHISVLEERLGQSLFRRNNNRVSPTENACELAAAVSLGLGHIRETWRKVYFSATRDDVVLACSFGFAEQWLLPRFARLRLALNGAQVRFVTTDQISDIDLNRVDAAVVWHLAHPSDRPAFPLVSEEAFPICSPAFAEREFGSVQIDPSDLARLKELVPDKFLHLDQGDSGYLTWDSWFAKVGLEAPRFDHRETFDAYPFMLQAVLNGDGIALGWRGLVEELIAQGRVLRAGPVVANRATAYYLQHRPVDNAESALAKLVAWFKLEASAAEGGRYLENENIISTR